MPPSKHEVCHGPDPPQRGTTDQNGARADWPELPHYTKTLFDGFFNGLYQTTIVLLFY